MNTSDQDVSLDASVKVRKLTVSSAALRVPKSYVPYLRLRGRWLEAAGFRIGRSVKVEVREGRLMIEPAD